VPNDLPGDKVPLILPQVANKGSLFHHETIRSLWNQAAKSVRHAKRVFCLGYSLPVSDELIRFFLMTNAATVPRPLYIADIRNMTDHFRHRLGNRYAINGEFAGIEDPIPTMLKALSRGALEIRATA
jgi:hypothetical protein